jgi:hypothetical protein
VTAVESSDDDVEKAHDTRPTTPFVRPRRR